MATAVARLAVSSSAWTVRPVLTASTLTTCGVSRLDLYAAVSVRTVGAECDDSNMRSDEAGGAVDPIVAELKASDGDVAVFAHGHLLRVLAVRWVELPPEAGARFWLATATISVLGFERETAAFRRWNAPVR